MTQTPANMHPVKKVSLLRLDDDNGGGNDPGAAEGADVTMLGIGRPIGVGVGDGATRHMASVGDGVSAPSYQYPRFCTHGWS